MSERPGPRRPPARPVPPHRLEWNSFVQFVLGAVLAVGLFLLCFYAWNSALLEWVSDTEDLFAVASYAVATAVVVVVAWRTGLQVLAVMCALVAAPLLLIGSACALMSQRFPVTVDVFGLDVRAHVLFEVAAYAVAFQIYRALRRRDGDVIEPLPRWAVIAAAAVGAALGSKLLFVLDDPAASWARLGDPAELLGGKTIVGGLLGGWIAVELVKRRLGIERRTGDLFAVPLCVGIAVGRIGCFLEGLGDRTYGVATSFPWGVDFGDGVRRHPTQIYEMAFLLVLAVPLRKATLRPHLEGSVFRSFLVGYLAWRLGVDFLKPGGTLLGMSGIQWACVAGLVWLLRDRARLRAAAPPAVRGRPSARGGRPEVRSVPGTRAEP